MDIEIKEVQEIIKNLEGSGELSIKEEKHLKVARLCVQLAAENLTMNRLLTDISDNHVEYFSEGEGYMFAGVPLDYVSEINMYVSRDVNAENPFPATDRIVAGIKADGVDMVLDLISHTNGMLYADSVKEMLSDVSSKLREGANHD
ncbi:hypothetical protein PRB94_gp44 [Klebsiella phage VLCpiS13c]|uniref:hypothetical protein n=1 Tax=Klebsiella phage VLCpiS13c TaxID=2874887 RepID=UPI00233F2F02|nr:hypothetical protein PRB94_gp44 [Klebsiella phage VLCpiS13c]UVX30172.1 hypothetical protein S13c_00044 [Klebsiella phage VLCpiS13c]